MLLDGCGGEAERLRMTNRNAVSKKGHRGHGGQEGEPSSYHQQAGEGMDVCVFLELDVEQLIKQLGPVMFM